MRTFKSMNPMASREYEQCCHCCVEQLSNGIMFYGNIKEAHWNVKGPNALDAHRMFDDLGEMILEHVDQLGERAVQLGGFAKIDPSASEIPNLTGKSTTAEEYIAELADGLAKYIKMLHSHITMTGDKNDLVSQNMFLNMSEEAEKQLMFLEMHLQK